MASHYKWYPSSEEVVVPFNARYSFPSQANKCVKTTPRIPPKNGGVFQPNQIIRLEFPAQGYVNPLNTTIEFDVTLFGFNWTTSNVEQTYFQNNIQSIFNRVRLLYGATPLEDIINYNVVVRMLSEWTATEQTGTVDQTSVAEGIGGCVVGRDGTAPGALAGFWGYNHVRKDYIQGIDGSSSSGTVTGTAPTTGANFTGGTGKGTVPNQTNSFSSVNPATDQMYTTRRYQINLALGLFTQDKLIPTKWMASQLAIELTLEQPANCIISHGSSGGTFTTTPTYQVGNVNLIPEILEFDASYDAMFLKGLREGGVPLKFSSWHTFIFNSNSANVQLLVQERSRSVKALFAVQRRATPSYNFDSHATFFDTSVHTAGATHSLQNYQFRIGGRYFPAQPVQCSTNLGTGIHNGGAEAMVELQKALNIVGDYRLKTAINTNRWAVPPSSTTVSVGYDPVAAAAATTYLPETDYATSLVNWSSNGQPSWQIVQSTTTANINSFCGNVGSCCFAMAIDLETSNGIEISGLNAEEQSDIALIANWYAAQGGDSINMVMEVYSYYDAMIILRENNVLELIQ